ncbi:unnamed protein product [Symbiodinium sp. CCMP2592]|nr:unnamed protein product [Symbiodinium sp. CCMP2592]
MSWGPWGPRKESKGSSVSPRSKEPRSVSPLQSRWSSARQAVERTVKTTTAVNALSRAARSNSPRPQPVGSSVVEWADHKQLKEIAKDLQRQLQRKEADTQRLTERVQTLVVLRDEQLSEIQAESRRLHYALEQEEVEVHRLRGRDSELQEALAAEVSGRQRAEQQLRQPCRDCAEYRAQHTETMADSQNLRTQLVEFEALKLHLKNSRMGQERLRTRLVQDLTQLLARHQDTSREGSPDTAGHASPRAEIPEKDRFDDVCSLRKC